jgi:hypothetical protein
MTPEQRLEAFLEHCQFVAQLHAAGRRAREAQPNPSVSNAN